MKIKKVNEMKRLFNDFDGFIQFLVRSEIKHSIFNFKSSTLKGNGEDIICVVAENEHSMEELDWVIAVFNSSKEKIVIVSATDNCDYTFDENYDVDSVKNVLENIGLLD